MDILKPEDLNQVMGHGGLCEISIRGTGVV